MLNDVHILYLIWIYRQAEGLKFTGPTSVSSADWDRTCQDWKGSQELRQQLNMGNTCREFWTIKEVLDCKTVLVEMKRTKMETDKGHLGHADLLSRWLMKVCSIDHLSSIWIKSVSRLLQLWRHNWRNLLDFSFFFFALTLMDTSVWWTHFPTYGSLRTDVHLQVFQFGK